MSNDKIAEVGVNIQEKATVIWNIANALFGYFKPHEYGLVILPMTVVKRFHDCLLPTHAAVREQYEKVKKLAVIDGFLTRASGYQFYNTSKYTFDLLLSDPDNIEANFRDYLAGFSANVQDVLAKFDFENIIKRMVECNSLYLVIKEFASPKGYLGPDRIGAVDCGYIFEDLVRRFSESYDEEAGAHFTSRDIIYLMTDILLSDADLTHAGNITVYDMAMGTSQMLSCMEERIHALNEEIEVTCFGQELNPATYAIAKADMMIRGGDPNNMRFGDTLSDDQFKGFTFRYCISNPPFGIDWKREQKAVEAEAALGALGRFAPGLPKISDGQQLFLLNGLSKLAPNGKMAIIQNGSPLFSGDAGSGPSNIRQYILENDWLDAIIQLSTDQFMNTGISTYIWVLSKDKPDYRTGKVQLIDASHCYESRRKNIGTKRNDITDQCRSLIVQAYGEYRDGAVYGDKGGVYCESKVFGSEAFGYNKIVVERPLRDEQGEIVLKKGKPVADPALRDTENVPLVEDIDRYFEREVLPYAPDAWIDHKKTKVGYEIPMTRYFYEYRPPEPVEEITNHIEELKVRATTSLDHLFSKCDDRHGAGQDQSTRPMKESGVVWIGPIPSSWDTSTLGRFITIASGISVGKKYDPETALIEVPYLRVANVQGDHVDLSEVATIMVTPEEAEKYKLRPGQLLMTEGGDRDKLGRGCLWNGEIENCIHQNHVFSVQTDEELSVRYLDYLTTSETGRIYFDMTAKKTTNLACTSKSTIQKFVIPVPSVHEQEAICDYLDSQCEKVDKAIADMEKIIEQLNNYKKSLIYEHVTGKKETPDGND